MTDWRFGGRGGGGLQRNAGAGGHLTYFVIFFRNFSFSSSLDIVGFLQFFTTETAENEFRRAGRAYFLIEEVRRIRLAVE